MRHLRTREQQRLLTNTASQERQRKGESFLRVFEEGTALRHLEFGLVASRTGRTEGSVVYITQWVALGYGFPGLLCPRKLPREMHLGAGSPVLVTSLSKPLSVPTARRTVAQGVL